MDEELRRFEEKQKLTNLQIDKRLALIENAIEDLKTKIETLNVPNISNARELLTEIKDMREHFDREVKKIETLQNALLGLEERGKLPQCDSSFANLDYDTRLLKEKIVDFQKRLRALEKNFIAFRISQPVVVE